MNNFEWLLLVEQTRRACRSSLGTEIGTPEPGDLVIEVTKFGTDPDAIGWLIGHGLAPYNEDGTGPTRIVWDVVPLSGASGKNTRYQRWENAEFVKVQTRIEIQIPAEVRELIEQRDSK